MSLFISRNFVVQQLKNAVRRPWPAWVISTAQRSAAPAPKSFDIYQKMKLINGKAGGPTVSGPAIHRDTGKTRPGRRPVVSKIEVLK
jgi:hypothetical protein